jgi:hypothetical protein
VLHGILQHSGAEISAHQTIAAEQETWSSTAQLAAELETIAAAAQHDRFVDLLQRSGLTQGRLKEAISSTAFGPLTAALRQAEAYHYNLEQLLPRVVAAHPLDDADDVAAVLRYRIETSVETSPRGKRSRPPRLIAGLIPEPVGPMDDEHREALARRKELIEGRAQSLAEEAVATNAAWTKRLGAEPSDRDERDRWLAALSTVAAYRDRYAVTTAQPLGEPARTDAQRSERRRAGQAAREAHRLSAEGDARDPRLDAEPLVIG